MLSVMSLIIYGKKYLIFQFFQYIKRLSAIELEAILWLKVINFIILLLN